MNSVLARMADGRPEGGMNLQYRLPNRATSPSAGHNLASRTGDQDRKWDGKVHVSNRLGYLAPAPALPFRVSRTRGRDQFHHPNRRSPPLSASSSSCPIGIG